MTTAQHAAGPSPHNLQPYSAATRAAIAKGPLTRQSLDERLQHAEQLGVHPLELVTEPEAVHLWEVGQTLKDAVLEDVLDAFQAVG